MPGAGRHAGWRSLQRLGEFFCFSCSHCKLLACLEASLSRQCLAPLPPRRPATWHAAPSPAGSGLLLETENVYTVAQQKVRVQGGERGMHAWQGRKAARMARPHGKAAWQSRMARPHGRIMRGACWRCPHPPTAKRGHVCRQARQATTVARQAAGPRARSRPHAWAGLLCPRRPPSQGLPVPLTWADGSWTRSARRFASTDGGTPHCMHGLGSVVAPQRPPQRPPFHGLLRRPPD
jgi:hypothetical protein